MILFCNYETYAVASDDSGKKFKGQGGRRVMYTTHHPCWDAKNRFDLPDKLPLDYSQIAHIIQNTSAAVTPAANPAPVQDPSAPAPDDSGRIPPVFQQPTSSSVSPSQSPPAAAANNNSVSSTNAGACTPPLTNDGRGMTAGAPCREMTAERFDVGDLSDFIEIPTEIRIPENIPQALKDLMRANNVSEEDIRFAVAGKGYFPERMPIEQYPPDFISGVLIAAWDQVYAIIKENQELPFN